MKKCLPGEGETPVGLCVKPVYLRVSPADVVDLIAGEFNSFTVEIAFHANLFWTHAFLYLISTNNPHRTLLSHFNFSNTWTDFMALVGRTIMLPIEATIGRLLEALFDALLSSIPGVPDWLTNALPEIEGLSLPPLPSLPSNGLMDPMAAFVADVEKIMAIPEDYFNQAAEKIPELPELPSASDIMETVDDYFTSTPLVELAGNVTSLLGMVSGCKQTTKLQVPSFVSLFKTLSIPGTSSWKDCNIEIPICSQLDFGDASAERLQGMEEMLSTLLEDATGAPRRGRRKLINLSELTENWNWLLLPIPIGVLLGKAASHFFPDTMDALTGKKAHLGTRTNVLGKGQIPLSNLGTDKATFNQYFVEYELLESIMPEIGFRKPENEKVQFDLVSHLSGRLVPRSLC